MPHRRGHGGKGDRQHGPGNHAYGLWQRLLHRQLGVRHGWARCRRQSLLDHASQQQCLTLGRTRWVLPVRERRRGNPLRVCARHDCSEWAGTLAPGASVAVVGYPKALGVSASITRGIVSRLFTQQGISYIQTDSAANPGNSGGPVVDACGRVAGLLSSGYDDAEGLNFAIAEPTLGRLLQAIRSGQSPPSVSTPTPDTGDPDAPTFWQINAHRRHRKGVEPHDRSSQHAGGEMGDHQRLREPALRQARGERPGTTWPGTTMVTTLEGLRTDNATRNTTASGYLEAAIAYWSANVAHKGSLEAYALDTVTWVVVEQAQATNAATSSYTRMPGATSGGFRAIRTQRMSARRRTLRRVRRRRLRQQPRSARLGADPRVHTQSSWP